MSMRVVGGMAWGVLAGLAGCGAPTLADQWRPVSSVGASEDPEDPAEEAAGLPDPGPDTGSADTGGTETPPDDDALAAAASDDPYRTIPNVDCSTAQTVRPPSDLEAWTSCQDARPVAVVGDLRLVDSDWQTLAPLWCVCSIEGSLAIDNNDRLESLYGLANLEELDSLVVSNSPELTTIPAPPRLPVLDALTLEALPALTDASLVTTTGAKRMVLRDLSSLEVLEDNPLFPDVVIEVLHVEDAPRLQTLGALEEIHEVGSLSLVDLPALATVDFAGLYTAGSFEVVQLPALTSLTTVLQSSVSVTLVDLPALTSLGGFVRLRFVEYLTIARADALLNLEGLSSIGEYASRTTYLELESNASLESLDGVGPSTNLSFTVRNHPALVGLGDLSSRQTLVDLILENNPVLETVDGLSNLEVVSGRLFLEHNLSLDNVDGLSALRSVGGSLVVLGNPGLRLGSLEGLSSLEAVGRNLEIRQEVQSLDGLSSLSSVGGDFLIRNNQSMRSVEGLEALASVGGNLRIEGTRLLGALTGLEALRTVGGTLQLHDNAALDDVSALHGVTSVGGDLVVTDNPSLTTAGDLADAVRDGVAGTITVSGNGP